ncbi:MAG: hypothetical protein ACRDS0_03525 [Pseudonocardiaceae bacterium]
MSIDWAHIAFTSCITAAALVGGFPAIFSLLWWLARQYYLLRKKNYGPASAQLIVIGSSIGAAGVFAPMIPLLYGSSLATPVTIGLIVVLITAPLVAGPAAVVAVLPPRRGFRRAGARTSRFVLSATVLWLTRGLWCAGVAIVVYAVTMLWSATSFALELLRFGSYLLITPAALTYYRKRASAPKLDEAISTDPRMPVLYLRAFHQESAPFMWVPTKERSRYTSEPVLAQGWRESSVTFEQYLGGEFTRELGPFVALGNPADALPPEGAARRYAADDDWQQNFVTLAESAASIVIEPSYSDNLRWEITTIITRHWQHKLFVITPPAPQSKPKRTLLWAYAAFRAAKGLPTPSWERFAAELSCTGLHIDQIPSPGSVVSFDSESQALLLIRGATEPDQFVAAVKRHLQASSRNVQSRIDGDE